MESQPIFAALRDALADLYPSIAEARLVVEDMGLVTRQIAFSVRGDKLA